MSHLAVIQSLEQGSNCLIEFLDCVEDSFTKTSQNPALRHQHIGFDFRFVLWLTHVRGYYRSVVVTA